MLSETAIKQFRESLRGELIQPGDQNYDEVRKVYNGMIDKKPAIIAKCVDVADVITAVNLGRENNVLISIRGGGHNAGGLGICDDGLVIDLSAINYVRIDQKSNTVRGGAELHGEMLIMLLMLLDLQSRLGLFQLPALEDLLLVVVLAT